MQHVQHVQYMQQMQQMHQMQQYNMQQYNMQQHTSSMPSMIPRMPYVQHNTAIRDGLNCFRTFTSKYSEPSINNCNYFPGLGCSPKTNVDEESSSCITPVTTFETDGKLGRDEMTDSGSDPECDLSQKTRQTNAASMRNWYEKKGYENVDKPKNEKRGKQKKPKVVVTVDSLGKSDLLRQAILEYVFQRTGCPVSLDQVLKLTSRHEKEKIIRFNEICLQHIVTYCIEKKCGKKRNHFPLCIDKCPHCPMQRIANNQAEWLCVKSLNPSFASHELREYTSSYSKKQTRGQSNDVVKYSDLRLNVCLYNANVTQPAISQQHKVKVMKGEYFNKIRTATPKAPTQPLNLTYARFWVEVVKDCVYLCIVDIEALKAYDEKQGTRRPIKSTIGAYVDGRMEVELAIMSSIPDTEVVFEWFVHKNYVNQWFRDGLTLGLHLTGNKEVKDWSWYQTVDTNVFAHNNIGHDQWPPMGYGPSGAPFDYQLPPQIIQPINNSYEQVCAEASYRLPETIASSIVWQPITDSVNGAPTSVSATTTPSPTLDNFQACETSPSNFDTIRTEAIPENNECQQRHGNKRKRSEMESETEVGMESHIMPLPSKRRVGPYQALCENELALFDQAPLDENPEEWWPERDPFYNRLGDSQ